MSGTTTIECKPLLDTHAIDRRDFAKDALGNYVLNPKTGQKELNWKCACGRTTGHSADYRGGSFEFVYDEAGAAKFAVA